MSSVLELMNYAAPYEGNFLRSIRALADALREQGMRTVMVFPDGARKHPWAASLAGEYPVYYLPRDTLAAARLLRRICRAHDVRTVHSHFVDSHFYLPLRLALVGRTALHI